MKRLLLVVLLAGCSTPQQRLTSNLPGYEEMCSRMGYQPRSEQMATCIRNLYTNDEQANTQRRAAATALGAAILANQPRPAAPAIRQTDCRWFANQWVCDSY